MISRTAAGKPLLTFYLFSIFFIQFERLYSLKVNMNSKRNSLTYTRYSQFSYWLKRWQIHSVLRSYLRIPKLDDGTKHKQSVRFLIIFSSRRIQSSTRVHVARREEKHCAGTTLSKYTFLASVPRAPHYVNVKYYFQGDTFICE